MQIYVFQGRGLTTDPIFIAGGKNGAWVGSDWSYGSIPTNRAKFWDIPCCTEQIQIN